LGYRSGGRGRHDLDRDPSDDPVPYGRDRPPSNRRRIVDRRGMVQPSGLLRTAAGSNNLRAICNGLQRDTNTPRPVRIQDRVVLGEREPHGGGPILIPIETCAYVIESVADSTPQAVL